MKTPESVNPDLVVQQVLANARLEGFEAIPELDALISDFAHGRLTLEEAQAKAATIVEARGKKIQKHMV